MQASATRLSSASCAVCPVGTKRFRDAARAAAAAPAVTALRLVSLWGPVAAYMAVIFMASANSNPPAPPHVSDKLLHLGAYAGLAVTICRALLGGLSPRLSWRAAFATLAITTAYGVTDELHQMFVPGRSPDVYDVAADAAGAVAGLIALRAWGIIRGSCFQHSTTNPAP